MIVASLLAVVLLSAIVIAALSIVVMRQSQQLISLSVLASERRPSEQAQLLRSAAQPAPPLDETTKAALAAAQPADGSRHALGL